MVARTRNALTLCLPLLTTPGIKIRLHSTVLYNSIYRADDELLINLHTYGTRASEAPVIYLARSEAESAAATYLDSFERVWVTARPTDQMRPRGR